jgi:hypothetical protein
MPKILGDPKKADAEYLDTCRSKRNIAEYEYVGAVTETESKELVGFTIEFKKEVIAWLATNHPELSGG